MERSWYMRHVWRDEMYSTQVLWQCMSSTTDENVTDETVGPLLDAAQFRDFYDRTDYDSDFFDSYVG